jgi:diguanylate cyclase (GGDEF)-like protein
MEESLEREMKRAGRQGKQVGVIMADIDHFKHLNDTFGHDGGDALLRKLGEYLQQRIRGGDIACRYGGEEFVLVLQGVSLEATLQRAEQVREDVKHLQVAQEGRVLDAITLSLGVAIFPDQGETPREVLQAADLALYRAKETGRDRTCVAGKV